MPLKRLLVTGGTGFVGSHVAERYAQKGVAVTCLDNVSRAQTLPTADARREVAEFNWNFLSKVPNVRLVKGDVRMPEQVEAAAQGVDAIVHTAAQVAVTSAVKDPRLDFEINALGSFNVFEAARKNDVPAVVYCSTNKVYGENVNTLPVKDTGSRYAFSDPAFQHGIPETLSIDHCEHTPYGVSKLAGDLYAQDYAALYGIRIGVFRMSCIYGTRQFGNEDQGWVAHFILHTLQGKPLTIFGDGKQVRDALHVSDLVEAYDAFLRGQHKHGVWNTGGGAGFTTSLLELVELLHTLTGKRSSLSFGDWRPSDQKVYISDIRKIQKDLGWAPKVDVASGVKTFIEWYNGTPLAKGHALAR